MADSNVLICKTVSSTPDNFEMQNTTNGKTNKRSMDVAYTIGEPNICFIGICAIDEPIIRRAAGTVMSPNNLTGLVIISGICPQSIRTIRIDK